VGKVIVNIMNRKINKVNVINMKIDAYVLLVINKDVKLQIIQEVKQLIGGRNESD
jgi:hypothetical protein